MTGSPSARGVLIVTINDDTSQGMLDTNCKNLKLITHCFSALLGSWRDDGRKAGKIQVRIFRHGRCKITTFWKIYNLCGLFNIMSNIMFNIIFI